MHQKLGNKKLITFYIFLIFLLSSINNYSLNISNFFKIKNIVVNGMSNDKNLKVESNLNFLLGENIFFLKDNIYNYFDRNNDVKNFNVKKLYPNSLEITITESKPICIILDKPVIGLPTRTSNLSPCLAQSMIQVISSAESFM